MPAILARSLARADPVIIQKHPSSKPKLMRANKVIVSGVALRRWDWLPSERFDERESDMLVSLHKIQMFRDRMWNESQCSVDVWV